MDMEKVSMAAHEADMDRMVGIVKNLCVIIALLIAVIIAGCFGFLHYTAQFETVEETYIEAQQDGSGTNVVGGGDVDYGAESENQKNQIPQA